MIRTSFRAAALAAASALIIPSAFAAKICVDPGHGGSDPGAVGNGQQEKTNVLNTGLKFRNWLNTDTADTRGGGSWTVIMTRTTDVYVSLSGRTTFANNNAAARFMSIHNNACCGASGTETFSYSSGSSTSHNLRNHVQQRGIQAWGLTNRGNKTASFYVIRYTNMPAELAELGFITHAYDASRLGNSGHQDNMAKHHLYAVQSHYGIAAYTPSTGGGSAQTYTDDSPACSANWSTGTSAGDKYGADYRFRPTAALSDAAAWSVTLAAGGNYDISAWWAAGTNRSASAPYILPGGNVNVNQQANGGKWNLLATRSLGSGASTVQLSCWAATGYVVVADAVRWYGPK